MGAAEGVKVALPAIEELLDGLLVILLDYSPFGDDGSYEVAGGDVEGGVSYLNTSWRYADALYVSDFIGAPLFNGDLSSIGDGEVDGGCRRGDVEGDAVGLCQNSN